MRTLLDSENIQEMSEGRKERRGKGQLGCREVRGAVRLTPPLAGGCIASGPAWESLGSPGLAGRGWTSGSRVEGNTTLSGHVLFSAAEVPEREYLIFLA